MLLGSLGAGVLSACNFWPFPYFWRDIAPQRLHAVADSIALTRYIKSLHSSIAFFLSHLFAPNLHSAMDANIRLANTLDRSVRISFRDFSFPQMASAKTLWHYILYISKWRNVLYCDSHSFRGSRSVFSKRKAIYAKSRDRILVIIQESFLIT